MRGGATGASPTRRPRLSRALGIASLALAESFSGRAVAADPTPLLPDETRKHPVYVDWGACDPLGEIASILRVELESRLAEGPPPEDAYRTTIRCAGGIVAISVGVPGNAPESFQTNLAGTPLNVRSRIVALALAELVRDLDRAPRPAVPTPPALLAPMPIPRDDDSVTAPPAPSHRGGLAAFAQATSFKFNGAWLAGGGLRFEYDFHHLFAGLDGALLTLDERFEPGTAQVFLAYGAPHVGWESTWGRAQGRLGAGYALGAATLSGHATGAGAFGGTTTGPWTAPYAFAALGFVIVDRVSFDARGEFGCVTSPVVGQVAGGGEVELRGALLSFQAGLTIAL